MKSQLPGDTPLLSPRDVNRTFAPGGGPGAVGYLVGGEGAGLAQLFHMMNEAGIAVGISAAALSYTGYLQSLAYARTRVQGRPIAARRSRRPGRPVPIIRHPDVRRMLMAQKSYAEGGLAVGLYAARLLDDIMTAEDETERENSRLLQEVLTPVVKSWPSQWCLEANSLPIQVHGGYGHTGNFNVEQLYRDNRLNAIHEGTHAIHGLDLLGRKVTMDSGASLRALLKWAVGDPGQPSATWRFTLRPEQAGTTLSQWVRLGPGRSGLSIAIDQMPDKEQKIIFLRLREFEESMTCTLAAIKTLAEQA